MKFRRDGQCRSLAAMLRLVLACSWSTIGSCYGGYLLVSSPSKKTISYARLLSAAEMSRGDKMNVITLAKSGQLQEPMGIAADSLRGLVYIADPTAGAVFVMRTYQSGVGLSAEEPRALITGLAPRWVAVDSTGTLLISDANGNRVVSVPATVTYNVATGASPTLQADSAEAVELYGSASLPNSPALQDPQGIVSDGSHVLWVNGAGGATAGSVVQAPNDADDPKRADGAAALANNADATTGLCMSGSRIFFTDGAQNIFSIPAGGGDVVTVSSGLQAGQGCAYDGDGTIFVADQAEGRVYSFAGKASDLQTTRPLSLAASVEDATGLAVMSWAWKSRAGWTTLVALLSALVSSCA